jgi:hypothetical protein
LIDAEVHRADAGRCERYHREGKIETNYLTNTNKESETFFVSLIGVDLQCSHGGINEQKLRGDHFGCRMNAIHFSQMTEGDTYLRGESLSWYEHFKLAARPHLDHKELEQISQPIDYRCADGRFLMSPRGMAVSNTRYISSSETRVNAGIRGWKLHLSELTFCQESIGGICFPNK